MDWARVGKKSAQGWGGIYRLNAGRSLKGVQDGTQFEFEHNPAVQIARLALHSKLREYGLRRIVVDISVGCALEITKTAYCRFVIVDADKPQSDSIGSVAVLLSTQWKIANGMSLSCFLTLRIKACRREPGFRIGETDGVSSPCESAAAPAARSAQANYRCQRPKKPQI
ncbi:MAG: hypothetical protein OXN84_08305 [Albidovulum sp.]|nr:hypothetical protein [Albidovulum sp.]